MGELITEQELVLHVFAHGGGPLAGAAATVISRMWEHCRTELDMRDRVPRLGLPVRLPDLALPGPAVLAACQRTDAAAQAVLRREHDVLNLSVVLSPAEGAWPDLDPLVDALLGEPARPVGELADEPEPALIGTARLYLGKAEGQQGPVAATPQLAAALPRWPHRPGRWTGGQQSSSGLALWESLTGSDSSGDRRLVVLAAPERDAELSDWTWSDGDPALPPLARYLMHTAKLRYQLRVYASYPAADQLCRRADEVLARLPPGPATTTGTAGAELRADHGRIVHLMATAKTIRHTVQIAVHNAAAAIGGELPVRGLIGDDRAVATAFTQRLSDDLTYLAAAEEGLRRLSDLAGARAMAAAETAAPSTALERGPTFGIITALPEEFTAVRAVLDGWQRRLVEDDRGVYVVGSMPSALPDQPHGVVLSLLGDTANNAAAEGCANLVRSFGTVTCVLMVGIAAGVPDVRRPQLHVRLGDVVAASWGVVDYDHVVDTPGGRQRRQPHPRPSPLLCRAAKLLEADERMGERPWERHLAEGLAALPEFARPPAQTDLVYGHDHASEPLAHPDPALSGHRTGLPRVHYGRIGSADCSLRNLARRDALAAEHDIRAIEMEGTGVGKAGFSSGVEWFVVRGISDYGDRRTGKGWRDHAALVAAAYARALLGACGPVGARGGRSLA